MSKEVKLPLSVVNHIFNYLIKRPYEEVADIITLLRENAEELPPKEPESEEEKEAEEKETSPVKAVSSE